MRTHKAIRYAGALTFVFFLGKGLFWLVLAAVVVLR